MMTIIHSEFWWWWRIYCAVYFSSGERCGLDKAQEPVPFFFFFLSFLFHWVIFWWRRIEKVYTIPQKFAMSEKWTRRVWPCPTGPAPYMSSQTWINWAQKFVKRDWWEAENKKTNKKARRKRERKGSRGNILLWQQTNKEQQGGGWGKGRKDIIDDGAVERCY